MFSKTKRQKHHPSARCGVRLRMLLASASSISKLARSALFAFAFAFGHEDSNSSQEDADSDPLFRLVGDGVTEEDDDEPPDNEDHADDMDEINLERASVSCGEAFFRFDGEAFFRLDGEARAVRLEQTKRIATSIILSRCVACACVCCWRLLPRSR